MRFALHGISALALVTAACGGSSTTGPTGTAGHGHITATIDGKSWSSTATEEAELVSGTLAVIGQDGVTLLNIVAPITATGTVSLSNGTPFVRAGSLTSSASPAGSWSTVGAGTGTVTVTVFTSTHVTGTFSFDALPIGGGATGTRHVTNGTFDLNLSAP